MAQRYSEFMTQPQIPGTGPTTQDFFSNRLFGNIRAGQPELGIYNTPQMQYLAEDDLESQNADWLYDQQGNVTREGHAIQQYISHAKQLGIQGPDARWQYATGMLQRDLLQNSYEQSQYQPAPQPQVMQHQPSPTPAPSSRT